MSLFLLDGVFCTGLSGFTTRDAARQAGFRWVAPVLTHDPAAAGNRKEIALNGPAYHAEGWLLCGWGTYGQADTAENDAAAAAKLCVDLGLAGWVANGEAWAEGPHIGKSAEFLAAWRKHGAPCPVAVSCLSSDTDLFAREFDYQSWLRSGSVIMPQVYGNAHPTYTVQAALGMLHLAGVPEDMLNVTFGTYTAPIPFQDYQGWSGPRTVYVGDQTPVTAWPKLARSAARPGTPPNEEDTMEWWEHPYPQAAPVYPGGLPYPLYPPDAAPAKTPTLDCPLTVAVKRAVSRLGRWPWATFSAAYTNEFAHGTSGNVGHTGVAGVQRQQGISPDTGWVGGATFTALNRARVPDGLPHAGEPAFDATAVLLIRQAAQEGPPAPSPIPDIGPVIPGGPSLLDLQLTHNTDGIPLFPAFDTAFGEGSPVIAPEDLLVDTRATSSNPGHAIYATGKSTLRYWIAHLDRDWPLGTRLARGVLVGRSIHNTVDSEAHTHWGVNGEAFLGAGVQFAYGRTGHGPDYTYGSPTIRKQLTDALL